MLRYTIEHATAMAIAAIFNAFEGHKLPVAIAFTTGTLLYLKASPLQLEPYQWFQTKLISRHKKSLFPATYPACATYPHTVSCRACRICRIKTHFIFE
jgi:hypothetical protein